MARGVHDSPDPTTRHRGLSTGQENDKHVIQLAWILAIAKNDESARLQPSGFQFRKDTKNVLTR